MSDYTLIMIFAGLVATGAIFIGYPLGYAFGRRDARQIYEADAATNEHFVMRRKRPRRDILSAEILTGREFPSEIDG